MEERPTYTYAQVAERIAEVLGVRPSPATLRAAGASSRRHGRTDSRVRLTAGLPAPVLQTPGHPTRFDAEQIEAWLANHPRLGRARAIATYHGLLGRPEVVEEEAVAYALRQGLSWTQIAGGLHQVRGDERGRSTIHAHYRHLTDLD